MMVMMMMTMMMTEMIMIMMMVIMLMMINVSISYWIDEQMEEYKFNSSGFTLQPTNQPGCDIFDGLFDFF